ncbi:LysE family transporter [Jejudonia soesokkakensis]|uniref:LysE family transporter n=1 Tax=Jejudonia soesokkakensis TaxID=1323432 RepID=A0ABW2MVX8_9FLAO
MIESSVMLLFFFATGFVISGLGSIPVSSTNVAVVTTAMDTSLKRAMGIVYGAALGSTLLAFLALFYHRLFTNYFEDNLWLQITFLALFFLMGLAILLRNQFNLSFENPLNKKWNVSNFTKGALLSFLNPPSLIFWILVISLANTYLLSLSIKSPVFYLVAFFCGIFFGRITVLTIYGKIGKKKDKSEKDNSLVYTIIGIALIGGTIVQAVRMIIDQ